MYLLNIRISESLVQLGESHELRQLLEENLDKYPTGWVGLFFVEVDTGHARPGQGVCIKQLPKELGHIAEFISLQAMHCAVLWGRKE